MSYFIITSSEDGTNIEKITKEELIDRVTPDEEGNTYYGGDTMSIRFLDSVPESDGAYWMLSDSDKVVSVLVIKGDIVKPKKVEVIQKYEF